MGTLKLDLNRSNGSNFRIGIDQAVLILVFHIKELVQSVVVPVLWIKFETEIENLLWQKNCHNLRLWPYSSLDFHIINNIPTLCTSKNIFFLIKIHVYFVCFKLTFIMWYLNLLSYSRLINEQTKLTSYLNECNLLSSFGSC